MRQSLHRTVPDHVPEALAASNVGTWKTGQNVHHYISDEAAASLFGLDAAEAPEGILLENYTQAVHPADREYLQERIDRSVKSGGLFVVEYRTVPRPGETRWVLARGRYERNPLTGEMQGRGILIDITESKLDGHVEDRALLMEPQADDPPLERIAGLVLHARRAIDDIRVEDRPILLRGIDALLLAIGRALARQEAGMRN